jgi:acyl-CoA synthetase (AMP-forming)/AMP-acid ligase II
MKFSSRDYKPSAVYINNPLKGVNISYFQLFANAIKIAKNNSNYPDDSLILILAKDETLLLSTIIACWINKYIPAIYSPNLTESEYSELNKQYNFTGVVAQEDLNLSNIESNILYEKFNFNLSLSNFEFEFDDDRIALVLFSSGTTGQPKAIPLSLANICNNINDFVDRLAISNSHKFLCASPIWHAHGLYNSFLTSFFLKTEVIYAGQLSIMNVNALLKEASKDKLTIFHITPSMIPILLAISKKISESELPNFYKIICGTSFLDLNSKRELEKTFKTSLIQQYGMTETLFISINEEFSNIKESSVGRPLSNINLEIWDEKVLQNNEEGAIRLKSNSWFGSYYDKNEIAIDDKYFYTGDLGYLDDDGCLYITGRIKDLIKKGGFSISSSEITNKILLISGVEAAYTFSIVDPRIGEEIYSFYVSENEIPKNVFLTELSKSISVKLLPKEYYKVDKLITTDTGKVSKLKMKEILESILNV